MVLKSLANTFRFTRNPLGFLERCQASTTTARVVPLLHDITYVANPETVQTLFTEHADEIDGSRTKRSQLTIRYQGRNYMENGLAQIDGDQWETHRNVLAPTMFGGALDEYAPDVNETVRTAVADLDGVADLHPCVERIYVRILLNGVFGAGLTDDEVDAMVEVMAAAEETREYSKPTNLLFSDGVPLPQNLRMKSAMERVIPIVEKVIAANDGDGTDNPVRALLGASEDGAVSEREVFDEVLFNMFAGHETVSTMTETVLSYLAVDDGYERRLEEEARTMLPDPSGTLTREDVRNPEFTTAMIDESLRLFPPIPFYTYSPVEPVTIDGYQFVPGENDVLFATPWAFHRDPEYWSNPETYDPDRWLEGSLSHGRAAYLPFGAGPRTCVGRDLALFMAKVLLAHLLRRYSVSHHGGTPRRDAETADCGAGMTLNPPRHAVEFESRDG